jgi:hypothetical protein
MEVGEWPERLRAKVETGPLPKWAPFLGPCWLWTAHCNPKGYGKFRFEGRSWMVHRLVYVLFVGAVEPAQEIDHLCRVRNCVRPGHLEAVSRLSNCLRGFSPSAQNARKTHCIHGHEFTAENTIVRKDGWRGCRACRSESNARRVRKLVV